MRVFLRASFLLLSMFTLTQGQGWWRKPRQEPAEVAEPSAAEPAVESSLKCDGNTDFELITGYVYSSADDIIDSKHRTLKVSDCIQSCRDNKECRAINFETGLCILFKTSAGENSAALAVSQLPVFTLYAQKICLPSSLQRCSTPWAYETTPGMSISDGYATTRFDSPSRRDCAIACLTETTFKCKSAAYSQLDGSCSLTSIDRNMAGRRQYLRVENDADLIEMACQKEEQVLCEFKPRNGRILKTVDSVYQDVESYEQCRQRCLDESFACHSYDFMSAGAKICRLSHHSTATLSHIQDPYIEVDNTTTYELRGCYEVNVECRRRDMVAKIRTSSLFDGKVYVKGRPNTCGVDVENATYIELELPYNDIKCDVTQEDDGVFLSNIVIQHHDMIVTAADVGLALHCRYDLQNTTVTNSLLSGLEVKDGIDSAEYIRETIVRSPNVSMIITNPMGDEIPSAQVGDNLALRFLILDADSPYEIFVRELVALDGQDSSEIMLLDERGCPTDPSILQPVTQVDGGRILQSVFQAFKFPSSDVVQFRALVTPCMPICEPVDCASSAFSGIITSYGRKKREIDSGETSSLLVAKSVRITDKFSFKDARIQEEIEKEYTIMDETCISFTAVLISAVLFLISQVIILMVWSYMWHKKRGQKQIKPISGSLPAEVLYGTGSSIRSHTSYLAD